MARYPRHINIIAERDNSKPDGVAFRMETPQGGQLEALVFSKDDERMKKEDEHEVHFKLVQEGGMTLEFAQSLRDALWVAWGTASNSPECPKSRPANTPDPIFYAERSSVDKLRVVNTNPDSCKFAFALNFVDPHSTTPTKLITYDPGGENQDGGSDAA